MYIGIDLGTSNSAIVGCENAQLRLFKAEDGRDVLPSVIHFSRSGNMTVGARAYAQADLAPGNVAQGFKRIMGTASEVPLPGANRSIAPEDASAEIIAALLRQAEAESGTRDFAGAIITIPAAFNQMQSEATIRAATRARLERVGLLQEPIAAAMAALEGATRRDGKFLVYDLGGGTFDVAVVEAVNGSVNILAHEGINMLGGRDFDRLIVQSVVRPWLDEHFDIPADASVQPRYARLFAVARYRAELAKIELSTRQETVIYLSDEDTRVEDENGEPIYVECPLTRATLEGLIIDKVDESIALCRKVLADNGLGHEDMDRIVMIGGPSKMPLVRDRVSGELGIPLDHQTDPMTAVARGAAIFAESRDWSQARGQRKSTRASTRSSGTIDLLVQYTARVSTDRATLRISAELPGPGFKYRIRGALGHDTGYADFDGKAQVTLPLATPGDNAFTVEVVDPEGRAACPAQAVCITRIAASASAIPATKTVSVKVARGPVAERRNTLVPLVTKGTPLPARGSETFKLRETLSTEPGSRFDIELYNQEPGVDDPLLNLPIGFFRFNGADVLDSGARLPAGSEVAVHWSMDDNGLITCTVELPDIGLHFDERNFYVSDGSHRNYDGEEGEQLVGALLDAAREALEETRTALGGRCGSDLAVLERRLARMTELKAQSADAEARRAVAEEALHIQQDLARLRTSPENLKAVILNDLDTFEENLAEVVDTFDAALIAQLQQLGMTVREMVAVGNWDNARRAFEQMRSILNRALFQQPAFVASLFQDVARARYAAVDKGLHDRLVADGLQAIESGDADRLRDILRQMFNNHIATDPGSGKASLLAALVQ